MISDKQIKDTIQAFCPIIKKTGLEGIESCLTWCSSNFDMQKLSFALANCAELLTCVDNLPKNAPKNIEKVITLLTEHRLAALLGKTKGNKTTPTGFGVVFSVSYFSYQLIKPILSDKNERLIFVCDEQWAHSCGIPENINSISNTENVELISEYTNEEESDLFSDILEKFIRLGVPYGLCLNDIKTIPGKINNLFWACKLLSNAAGHIYAGHEKQAEIFLSGARREIKLC